MSVLKKNTQIVIDTLVYKVRTYNFIIKNKKSLFNKIWLGYKYDDNILDINIKKLNKISIEEIERTLEIDSVWKNLIHVDRNLVYTPGKFLDIPLENKFLMKML